MGCHGALNALKVAHHIVRSEPDARVLVVNLELCTLHLQETDSLEQVLCFLLFGDGCAASLVTGAPVGIEIGRFRTFLAPGTRDLITWRIGDAGFDMLLSGGVPAAISSLLEHEVVQILGDNPAGALPLWAVHPGGRSVLDAVQETLGLADAALAPSRDVLRRFGNMSSATVMFVLAEMLRTATAGDAGCAMAFGPGVTAETMLFRIADHAGG
jgi:predicted naringenin-chalcone synthase